MVDRAYIGMPETEDCGGCTYWDGDDGRCRNDKSQHFMNESNDGCDEKCRLDESKPDIEQR